MTASINRVELLDGAFGPSSRARVHQPRLPAAVWTVTEFEENTGFTWESRSPGVTTVAGHHLSAKPDGTVTVRLSIDQTGPLAPVVSLLTGRLTRRYVTMEAHGLKNAAERS